MTLVQAVAYGQAGYYVITGVWPWVHMRSFLAVTGPKVDLWLVKTVGALVIVIGVSLWTAAWGGRVTGDVVLLGAGACVGLGFVDSWFSVRGVISKVYLVDAVVQVGMLAGWIVGWCNRG